MDVLLDETESLEAILMDDVQITRNRDTGVPEVIETTIFPVVENESEQQYICVNLQVIPSEGYPDVSPKFNLLKPRGLDDHRLNEIKQACVNKLKDAQGFPVVFDLIEVVREHLSGSNLPSGQCVVCLYGFCDGDEFTKTECYHYLHSYCLERHLLAARKNYQEEQEKLPAWIRKASDPFQASCPVCREPIKDESETLKNCLPPAELANAPEFRLTDELVSLQQKMASLFIQQKQRGGIIDVEAEVGPVISIEPGDRQMGDQTKSNSNSIPEANSFVKDDRSTLEQSNPIKKSGCSGETSVRTQRVPSGRRAAAAAYSNNDVIRVEANSSSTNFAPVVTQSQRVASDPTNNNYHHHYNRRHIRGGGRRHHHHHSHRSENNCSSHPHPHSHPHSPPAATLPSVQPTSQPNSSKQHKGLANCSASTR